ncbi:hypothetical protein HZB78_00710 [Candidatus Collierbacteria bacterium]|nr:hypothetical protein [Candidatus Collierbacteria bacterium]
MVNLAMTNSLASDGKGLAGLMDKRNNLSLSTANLEEKIMTAGSLVLVENRAKQLGFSLPLKLTAIKFDLQSIKGDQ